MKTHHHFRSALFAVLCITATNGATAQADCFGVTVDHLWYAAFTDTSLELHVQNPGTTQINYPWFSILDNNGDTVARSFGSFFVLPTGTVRNNLPILPGAGQLTSPFTGTVLMHYAAFPGDSTCSIPVTNLELCPPAPCTEVILYVYQVDTIGEAHMGWAVFDTANVPVATSSMHIIPGDPSSYIDTLCLPTGSYVLNIDDVTFVPSGTFVATFMRGLYDLGGPNVQFFDEGSLAFDFFPACVDGTNAIEEFASQPLLIAQSGTLLTVTDPRGNPLEEITIFNAQGSLIDQRRTKAATSALDMVGHASGVYLLRSSANGGMWAQRFILP